jgi:hypothetical protein
MLNVISIFVCSHSRSFRAFDCKMLALSAVEATIVCYPKGDAQALPLSMPRRASALSYRPLGRELMTL